MSTQQARMEKVLMVVKTYPTPSNAHGELVCTAGIRLRDLTWVRIYPFPFRLVNRQERFEKYDIIEVPLERATQDPRPDSYRLYDIAAIKKVGHLDVDKFWSKRMPYIRKTALASVADLMDTMLPVDGSGWGSSIRPVPVSTDSLRVSWEYIGDQWSDGDLRKVKRAEEKLRNNVFADEDVRAYFRQLKRVPYRFRLTFTDLTGTEYTLPILDWEIAQLYFNIATSDRTPEEALEKVRYKIEEQIFAPGREVFLVLGNIHHRFKQRRSLAVDGFVYPERQLQFSLFGDEDG